MAIEFTVTGVVPASPEEVYRAWLESDGHSRMTGSPAHCSDRVGGRFDAWDGYIGGRNLALEPGHRIVQTWRTTKFAPEDADSRLEIVLEAVPDGTRITLRHSQVPDGHDHYRAGWLSHYIQPMQRYFGGTAEPAGGS